MRERLARIPGVEVHAATEDGRLVVTVEGTEEHPTLETINSLVDERRDPVKSTHSAARFMKDLYGIYGDWILVIAAYNCGPGNTRRALRTLDPQRRVPSRVDPQRVEKALLSRTPKETRSYLRLVTERRRIWH